MAKSTKAEKARKARLVEGRKLTREKIKHIKAEKELLTTKQKVAERRTRERLARIRRWAKGTKKRQVGTRRLLTAIGVIAGPATQAGPGRPRGTYKYGMPIDVYKRLLAERKANVQRYQQEQLIAYQRRGVTPEQIQRTRQLQVQRTVEQGVPVEVPMRKGDEPERMVDDELGFKQWEAQRVLSPSARAILTRLRRVQNKGKLDNIRQQRIHEERRIISDKANMFKAHENMIDVSMDMTGVSQDNILKAPNVFREIPGNQIMRTNRPNILQTKETGLNLRF